MPHKVAVSGGAPQYRQVDISYRIPGTHRALLHSSFDDEDGVVGAAGEIDSQPGASRSTAALTIEYPHPDGDSEMARATLRLSRKVLLPQRRSFVGKVRSSISWLPGAPLAAGVAPAADDEVWVLDFPRQQLDLMLFDLARSGFFDDQDRHEGIAHLSVAIDRGRMSKTWSPEARLDDVVLRVLRDGRPAD